MSVTVRACARVIVRLDVQKNLNSATEGVQVVQEVKHAYRNSYCVFVPFCVFSLKLEVMGKNYWV